jgi:hypothetical protein
MGDADNITKTYILMIIMQIINEYQQFYISKISNLNNIEN